MYTGTEINMLNLGNADSILIRRWENSSYPTVTLIDGGNKSDTARVKSYLQGLGIVHVDHLVCTHPHDDHAGGLLDLVSDDDLSFGRAWMHIPRNHIDLGKVYFSLAAGKGRAAKVVAMAEKSLATTSDLESRLITKGVPISEPFSGTAIGNLLVLSPTEAFYREQLAEFTNLDTLTKMENEFETHQRLLLSEKLYGTRATFSEGEGLGKAPTAPENESSVVLWGIEGSNTFMTTADAGTTALGMIKDALPAFGGLSWVQIPHHGSRRNVNEEIIAYLNPDIAVVSASGNDEKHPRKAVVDAFKKQGASVFSTHYPEAGARVTTYGSVPSRGLGSGTPLYNAA